MRHLDGNSLNNSIDNIEIGSWTDNRLDIKKEIRTSLAKMQQKELLSTQELYKK